MAHASTSSVARAADVWGAIRVQGPLSIRRQGGSANDMSLEVYQLGMDLRQMRGAVLTIPGVGPGAVKEYLSGETALSKGFVIGFWLITPTLTVIFWKSGPDDGHPLKKLHHLPLPAIFDKLIRAPNCHGKSLELLRLSGDGCI